MERERKSLQSQKSSLIEEEEEEEEEDETAEGGLVQRANCSQYNAMTNMSKNTRKARCLNNPACRWKGKEKVCKAKKSSLIEEEEEEEEEEEDETAEGGLVQRANCSQYNAMANVSKNTRKARCLNNPACRW